MSKFKVGDLVLVKKANCTRNLVGKKVKIISISNGEIRVEGSISFWNDDSDTAENCLELVSPQQPLTNTIITNITSPEQHKRVQEKLFGMGHTKLQFGKNEDHIYIDCRGILSYWGGNKFDEAIKKCTVAYGRPEQIPASEFLGEDITKTTRDGSMGTSFVYGRSLPEKYIGIDFGETVPSSLQKELNKLNNPSTFPREGKGTKIMENIVSFFNDLTVSQEDKELRKAGLKDGELTWTSNSLEIIKNLEAKERGYKNFNEMEKVIRYNGEEKGAFSLLEAETLYKKFYTKLLETAEV